MREVIHEYPPNIEAIAHKYPGALGAGVIFAYAPFIFAPTHRGKNLPRELIAHEELHIERQLALGVEKWWGIYLTNPTFVFVEELLAHRAEYHYVMRNGSRSQRRSAEKVIPQKLAAALYGNMVNEWRARELIMKEEVYACHACGGTGHNAQLVECGKCEGAGYLELEEAA